MKHYATLMLRPIVAAISLAFTLATPGAFAHGNEVHKKDKNAPISTDVHGFGQEGDPKNVTRTINIGMSDSMRYDPSQIKVKQGETVRFVIKNNGKVLHELVIGSMEELKAHGELMKKNPEMDHADPYMAHVKAGGKEEIIWKFTKAGDFNYGCLAPGHFESGMIGKITVTKS